MRIDELVGLRIATVDVGEALDTDWSVWGDRADLVRVDRPDPALWGRLVAAGFVVKPDRVTWLAETGDDERDFLSRISRKEREGVAKARRAVQRAGLTWRQAPLDEAGWRAFLDLYEPAVARMRNGLAVAGRHWEAIVPQLADYFLLGGYDDAGALRGAAVGQWCPQVPVARLRFSAVSGEQRDASLSRVLYLEAVRAAREAGYAQVTLGNDPNLYGHLVMPGLFAFKARLGFVAVPSTMVDPTDGFDVADLLLSTKALSDPAFLLGYPDTGRSRDLTFDFFSRTDDPDIRLYTTCRPAPVRMHRID
ncbi:hypothetical protein V6U90_22895 [Micromonospora sp. CPCC 206060]|uniref:hypothetical protein n=1 Tax=Micromonospora sp. CPCC 206060 TaxID=3122406 RepID=UPI002FF33984